MKQLLTITALLFSVTSFGQTNKKYPIDTLPLIKVGGGKTFDDTLLRFDWGVPKSVVKWQLVKAVPTACPDAAITDKFGRTSNSYFSCAVAHYELKREKLSKEFKSVYLALQFYKELVEESKKGHQLFQNGIDSIETIPKYISTLSDDTIRIAGYGIKIDTNYVYKADLPKNEWKVITHDGEIAKIKSSGQDTLEITYPALIKNNHLFKYIKVGDKIFEEVKPIRTCWQPTPYYGYGVITPAIGIMPDSFKINHADTSYLIKKHKKQ